MWASVSRGRGDPGLCGRVEGRGAQVGGRARWRVGLKARSVLCAVEDLVINDVGSEGALASRASTIDHHHAHSAALADPRHGNVELAVGEA